MDFRLRAFIAVAQQLNFTKAAKELFISQPAISKHIQELENIYGVQLFERNGSKITLTSAGEIFLKHAESITNSYKELQLEMNLWSGKFTGNLKVGASTTIAQHTLPPKIAQFIMAFPDIKLSVIMGNSEQIEQALREHTIDVGLVEGIHRKNEFKHVHFMKDELVLVTSVKNKTKSEITLEDLLKLPLVLRENGSGTLDVIERKLSNHHIKLSKLNILLQLGSTESIKSFLESYPNSFAIVSISALQNEIKGNRLKVIDIKEVGFERVFTFILNQGEQNDIVEKFIRLLSAPSSF